MKFAIFGNPYQVNKSAHVLRLIEILLHYQAGLCIDREFYLSEYIGHIFKEFHCLVNGHIEHIGNTLTFVSYF